MKNRDAFSGYHPFINFFYFGLVLVFAMCLMHPVCLGVSLFSAAAYAVCLNGRKAVKMILAAMLPMLLFTALVNPAFSHEGATILTFLPSGNPLTLESILYGVAAAAMLVSVILWFSCYTEVMTSDKFVYLFGRIIPALSLILSMALRFVPKFRAQLHTISDAQRCLGRDVSKGSMLSRISKAVTITSILITWAMENAIETADSMKSRGYGLPGRTAFSIYRFDERDKNMLWWLAGCGAFLMVAWLTGGFYWNYYPTLRGAPAAPLTVLYWGVYLALCLTPVMVDYRDGRYWKSKTPCPAKAPACPEKEQEHWTKEAEELCR